MIFLVILKRGMTLMTVSSANVNASAGVVKSAVVRLCLGRTVPLAF